MKPNSLNSSMVMLPLPSMSIKLKHVRECLNRNSFSRWSYHSGHSCSGVHAPSMRLIPHLDGNQDAHEHVELIEFQVAGFIQIEHIHQTVAMSFAQACHRPALQTLTERAQQGSRAARCGAPQ